MRDANDVIEAIEDSAIEFDYVEREGPDVRFDIGNRSFWLRARTDGGLDAEGVSNKKVADLLIGLGFSCGKASEGYYSWKPKS